MGAQNNLNQDDQFLHDLHTIVLDNLGNESFSVEDLAEIYGISRSQLHRKLKKLKNKSISRYIREIRLDESLQMLKDDVGTVSEIAYKVGFSSPTYFNTCFRDYFGFPPGEARFRSASENEIHTTDETVTKTISTTSPKPSKLVWFLAGFILVLLMFFIVYYKGNSANSSITASEPPDSDEISIAVMPFQNLSTDNEDLFYCNGMMQNILDNLSIIPEFRVLPSRTTYLYKDTELLPTQLGEELGVQYILDGTFQKIDSQIQVSLALTRTNDGRQIWTNENADFSLPELFSMQAEIANQVANQLKISLSKDLNKTMRNIPTRDKLAYEYYLRGKEKLNDVNYNTQTNRANALLLHEAKLLFNLAIEQDSNFASAYLGLARTEYSENKDLLPNYIKDSTPVQFEKLVDKALDINPELSEGYFLKGNYFLYGFNSPNEAEQNWLIALDKNPNNLDVLYALAELYMGRKMDIIQSIKLLKEIEYRTVDEQELYEIYRRLSQLYSKLLDLKTEWFYLQKMNEIDDNAADLAIPWYYLRSGKTEKALAELTRRFPNTDNQFQLVLRGLYLSQNGQFEEAVEYYKQWEKLVDVQSEDNWFSENDWHRYGQALVKSGQDSLGISLIRKQISFYKQQIEMNQDASIYDLVGCYSFLNELDSAYYYLNNLSEEGFLRGWGNASFKLVDYQYENLRSDPRFIEMFEAEKLKIREIRKQVLEVDPDVVVLE